MDILQKRGKRSNGCYFPVKDFMACFQRLKTFEAMGNTIAFSGTVSCVRWLGMNGACSVERRVSFREVEIERRNTSRTILYYIQLVKG